ncbi:hypothetical protein BN1012_Phect618 [Candidatus Phaeomarinobacter ectocarpi]|uniref:Autotransporter domain-containing protein n=1 Tax=Candidatus Phaeomarinibacter ectocarpi TaxID=1458461 RepID=X5MC60_9HYPH|nr:autotransporter outer membrane beta-barrel domain-containing protein [Candidatus Phaeomarinobacter ectocarpi]CDO58832.1 hypothetical protein BN1012_Phect618 [Candidatus Phaeomarinobacter ectocarpi]
MFAHYSTRLQLALAALCAIVYVALPGTAAAQTAVSCPTGIGAGAVCTCAGGTLTIVEPPNPVFNEANSSACAAPTPTQSLGMTPIPQGELQQRIDRDLEEIKQGRVLDRFIQRLGLDRALEQLGRVEEEAKEEPEEESDNADLLKSYQNQLQDALNDLARLNGNIENLNQQKDDIKSEIERARDDQTRLADDNKTLADDRANEQVNQEALKEKLADYESGTEQYDKAFSAYQTALQNQSYWQSIVSNYGKLSIQDAQDLLNRGIGLKAATNYLSAANLRVQVAANDLAAAKAAHPEAEAGRKRIETEISQSQDRITTINNTIASNENKIEALSGDIVDLEAAINMADGTINSIRRIEIPPVQARIAKLKSLIAALKSDNQFAGPGTGPFDALRSRGIELFVATGYRATTDKQVGRNVEADDVNVSAGIQARFTERLVAGLGINVAVSDSDDKTGTGTSTDSTSVAIAPYAVYQLDEGLAATGSLVYARTKNDITRAGIANADYLSHTYGGAIGLSAQRRLSQWIAITGGINQSYFHTSSDGYTDTIGLTISDSSTNTATSSLAGRMDIFPADGWRVFGGTSVNYATIELANDLDRLDASISGGIERNWGNASVLAQVNHLAFRNNLDTTGVSLQLRVPW